MKMTDWSLAVAGIAAAVALAAPRGRAFAPNGEVLGLDQRDFRIFPNFTDPTIDNQDPDPDYPTATGAKLAIWKGIAEWGSRRHGSGLSDPTQPDGIGSGASNFDAYYLGEAIGPGNTDANVVSQLDGAGGGIRAFAELPSSDGWRIRFYRDPTEWHDGPGLVIPVGNNAFDLQGVAAHEYGHVLGLGHSGGNATMSTNTTGRGVPLRSIEPDDIAGVQSIYGTVDPIKPFLETYELGSGTDLTLVGGNFAAQGNTVWFSRIVPGGMGEIIEVSGLDSSAGGTRIDVSIPSGAGPGDVIVRTPGQEFSAISNAMPIAFDRITCVEPERIGLPKLASNGNLPRMVIEGVPSASIGTFDIGTDEGLLDGLGILFSGPRVGQRPFAGGTIHVGPPYRREAVFQFQFSFARVTLPITPSMVGTSRVYQIWFIDPGDAFGVGLTDGLKVTFCE